MFGDDSDNDEKLSVNESGDESDVGSRKRRQNANGDADVDVDEDVEGQEEEMLEEELFGDEEEDDGKKPQYVYSSQVTQLKCTGQMTECKPNH